MVEEVVTSAWWKFPAVSAMKCGVQVMVTLEMVADMVKKWKARRAALQQKAHELDTVRLAEEAAVPNVTSSSLAMSTPLTASGSIRRSVFVSGA